VTATPAVVVDASVAVKWLVPEEDYTAQARQLLADSMTIALVGPPQLFGEVGSVLYQRTRLRDDPLPLAEADRLLGQFLALQITLLAPPGLYERALVFGRQVGIRSYYDSLNVVLAQLLGTTLWTDDRDLLRDLGAAAPWVRWIRDYPQPAPPAP
jgi:predicted nucleic acid-binding protein